ncbi:MAG: hypothetical protein LBL52_03470 [Rickettsiales bacterium]|jgi:hypothetical protein|nr:hypothetical protein [Rickettsiales bacterium]
MKRGILALLCAACATSHIKYEAGEVAKCRDYSAWCEKGGARRADGRQEYLAPYKIMIDGKFVEKQDGLRTINIYRGGRLAVAERIVVADDVPAPIARSITHYYDWGLQVEKFEEGKFEISSAECEYKDDIVHYFGEALQENMRANKGEFKCPKS